jgi:hypothetical protein
VNKPYILDNHTDAVVRHLLRAPAAVPEEVVVGIVVDNAGYEIFTDLVLGHVLLSMACCTKVIFHTKSHPTFVSDATTLDCEETIATLLASPKAETRALGASFSSHVSSGSFAFESDAFFCQPPPFWCMPPRVEAKFRLECMTFVKGDANYRRLIGDCDWGPKSTATAEQVLSYWPGSVCALRTLKSEVKCGIDEDKEMEAAAKDCNWLVCGKWGVVQTNLKS